MSYCNPCDPHVEDLYREADLDDLCECDECEEVDTFCTLCGESIRDCYCDPHGDIDNTFDLALEELQTLLLQWHMNQANLEYAAAFGLFETEERREIRATCQADQKKLLSSLSPLAKEVLEGRHVVELGSVVVLATVDESGVVFVEAVEPLVL